MQSCHGRVRKHSAPHECWPSAERLCWIWGQLFLPHPSVLSSFRRHCQSLLCLFWMWSDNFLIFLIKLVYFLLTFWLAVTWQVHVVIVSLLWSALLWYRLKNFVLNCLFLLFVCLFIPWRHQNFSSFIDDIFALVKHIPCSFTCRHAKNLLHDLHLHFSIVHWCFHFQFGWSHCSSSFFVGWGKKMPGLSCLWEKKKSVSKKTHKFYTFILFPPPSNYLTILIFWCKQSLG